MQAWPTRHRFSADCRKICCDAGHMLLVHGPSGTATCRVLRPSWPMASLLTAALCICRDARRPITRQHSRFCSKPGAGIMLLHQKVVVGHPPQQRKSSKISSASPITAFLYMCRVGEHAIGARCGPPARQRKAQCAHPARAPQQRREQPPACDLPRSAGRRAEQRARSGAGQPLWGFDDGHVWGGFDLAPAHASSSCSAQVAAFCTQ